MEELQRAVKKAFDAGSSPAHDYKHAERVAALARHIAVQEGYDADLAEVAGLLHDMGRTVQMEDAGHGPAGVPLARQLLAAHMTYDAETTEQVLRAVEHHSELHTTGELLHIVQDADMLDGMGATGIMRAYMSKYYLPDYDPNTIVPTAGKREATAHEQIAFQMEWLGLMHTATGRRIAKGRHQYMLDFLHTVEKEVTRKDLGDE